MGEGKGCKGEPALAGSRGLSLRILFATWKLDNHVGGELFALELALALKALGHEPVIHAPVGGRLSDQAARRGVEVVGRLSRLRRPPDVIHAQHNAALVMALRAFPSTPVVSVVHGSLDIFEPFAAPRIVRYVAVDDRCAAWVRSRPQIPAERVRVILNFADLDRFRPRPPLPARPSRAVVFSNYAGERAHLPPILEACRRQGLTVDVLGAQAGRFSERPEDFLPAYDIAFAKARCAIEALVVGCAVVLCDFPGLGPMVSGANLQALRRMNFGVGVLTAPHDPEAIERAILAYDAADAALVSARMREEAGLGKAALAYVNVYEDCIASARNLVLDPAAEAAAIRLEARRWRGHLILAQLAAIPWLGLSLYRLLRSLRRLGRAWFRSK